MTKEQDAHNKRTFKLAIVSLIVSAILGGGNLLYQIIRDHYSKASYDVRFGKIETTLRLLTGTLAPQLQKAVDDSLASAVSGSLSNAQDKIAYANVALRQLREAKVQLPTAAVETTNQNVHNLIEAKGDIPETWSVAAEFISYRSALTHADLVDLGSSMPSCVDGPPHPMTTAAPVTKPGLQTVPINPAHYDNCRIQMDSPRDQALLGYWTQFIPSFSTLIFKHCLVIYNGGVVSLQLHTPITFENSLWKFSVPNTPPLSGQKVTETLLSSNPDSFTLEGS